MQYISERAPTAKIEVERFNQKKRLAEFAGYMTLAGNQQ